MFVHMVIYATLGVLDADLFCQAQQQAQAPQQSPLATTRARPSTAPPLKAPEPPLDNNPDCEAIKEHIPKHLYRNCTFVCKDGEKFLLNSSETCFQPDPIEDMPVRNGIRTVTGDMGNCKNGTCVVPGSELPPKKPKPPKRTRKPKPPKDVSPDCNHLKASNYVYKECSFVCQRDEMFALRSREPCVLPRQSTSRAAPLLEGSATASVTGVCLDGKCVPNNTVTPTENPGKPTPPQETNPDCLASKKNGSDYLYHNCSFLCEEDEIVSLVDRQSCVLKETPPKRQGTPGGLPVLDLGFCVEGKCFPPDSVGPPSINGNPSPPRDTNPDCIAWKKNQTDHAYNNCTFLCEGDEEVPLGNREFCVLNPPSQAPSKNRKKGTDEGSTDLGNCIDGKCLPLNGQTPGTNGKPAPPHDTNPDCDAWKKNLTNYLYHTCTFQCEGDEQVSLRNNQSCVLHATSQPHAKNQVAGELGTVDMGYCKDGQCVALTNKVPPNTPGKPQPPRDTNPDCFAWKNHQSDYLYHTCMFTCEQDETVPLSDKQSCILQPASEAPMKNGGELGTADMGHCINGECVPLSTNTTLITTKKPGPPHETNPDCTAWMNSRTDNIYHTCAFTCEGDEGVALHNKESCILQATSQSPKKNRTSVFLLSGNIGVCEGGKCVEQNTKMPPEKPKLPVPKPPTDINPDCNGPDKDSGDYVYQNCSFVCEDDEASYLNNSEKCVLQGQTPVTVPTSLQGTTAAFVTGVCKEGTCVPEGTGQPTNTGRPRPPRVRNPDCRAWNKRRVKYTYRNCTFLCGGDEVVYLKQGEKCKLQEGPSLSTTSNSTNQDKGARRKGVCVKGVCLPKKTKMPPQIAARSPSSNPSSQS